MTTYLYTRVSTHQQSTNVQTHALTARWPDAVVVEETASGAKRRPALESLLSRLQAGDTLVVAALDRLGRRCSELVLLMETLQRKSVTLVSVREGIDLSTMGGQLVANVFAALAQLEREVLSERTKQALATCRARGVRLGRPPTVTDETVNTVRLLIRKGHPDAEIARMVGIHRVQVGRYRRKLAAAV